MNTMKKLFIVACMVGASAYASDEAKKAESLPEIVKETQQLKAILAALEKARPCKDIPQHVELMTSIQCLAKTPGWTRLCTDSCDR